MERKLFEKYNKKINEISLNMYNDIYKIVNDTDDKFIDLSDGFANAIVFDDDLSSDVDVCVYGLGIFDNSLCILIEPFETKEEALESSEWISIYGGKVNYTCTLLNLLENLDSLYLDDSL